MPDDVEMVSVEFQPWEWEDIREGLRVGVRASKALAEKNGLEMGPIVESAERWLGYRVFITDRLREER